MNIQAPPNLLMESDDALPAFPEPEPVSAADGVASYLAAGINDWGGISPVTIDHINPERAWPAVDALREETRAAGFDLRERLCLYPEYLEQPFFVRDRLRSSMEAWTDPSGLVRVEQTRWT
jgi:FO synthase